ncbi:MAG: hypothetical protein ACYTGV_05860 [Planctomycetota bacterium]|jgi:hypothetical protein
MAISLADNLATEFLRLFDEGWQPDVEEFLCRVPEEVRDECRQRINELATLNGIDTGTSPTEQGPEPEPMEELAQEIPPAHEDLPVESASVEADAVAMDPAVPDGPDSVLQLEAEEEPEPLGEPAQETPSADTDLPFEPVSEGAEPAEAASQTVDAPAPIDEAAQESPSADRDLPFEPAADEAELAEAAEESPPADRELPWQPVVAVRSAPYREDLDSPSQLASLNDETKELPTELSAVDAVELADREEQPQTVDRVMEPGDEDAACHDEGGTPAVPGLQTAADTLQAYAEEAAEEAEPQADEAEHVEEEIEPEPEQVPVEDAAIYEDTDPMPLTAAQEQKLAEASEPEEAEPVVAEAEDDPDDLVEGSHETEEEEEAPARDDPHYAPVVMPKKTAQPRPQPSLSELEPNLLRQMREVDSWKRRGHVPEQDCDRLTAIYRRLLDHEPATNMGELSASLASVLLSAVATVAAVGTALFVWFASAGLPPLAQWAPPVFVCVALLGAGLWARFRRHDDLGATIFFAAAVLAAMPAALAAAIAFGFLAAPTPGVVQLLADGSATNGQLFVAVCAGLAISLAAFGLVRRALFAAMTALLVAAAYVAFLLWQNLLGLEMHHAALRLLPLVVMVLPARLFEYRGRARCVLPFDLIAIVALVACLDAMAVGGEVFRMLGVDHVVAATRQPYLGFTLVGLFLLALVFLMELARSSVLNTGARLLSVLAAVHIVASLYAGAAHHGAWGDLLAYFGVTAGLLLLCRWHCRRAFFVVGMAGLISGCYLFLSLGLVSPVGLTVGFAGGGLVAAIGLYAYLQKSREPEETEPEAATES